MAELVSYALVEARTGELCEAADRIEEADLQILPRLQLGEPAAVDGHLDRLALRRVLDVENVAGGDDEGARGQRVRGDVADHVSLHSPGQDRTLVGEVVAGRTDRGGGDDAVAAHVPHLFAGDPVAELGHAVMGLPGEGDVVEAARLHLVAADLQPGQLDRLELAFEGAADALASILPLDRGKKADGAEVDPEDRYFGAGVAAQRVQDRAVATQDQADLGQRVLGGDVDALTGGAVLSQLVLAGGQAPAELMGDL